MALEIVTVQCLSDNYAYLLHDQDTGATALFDAPEAAPIAAALKKRKWRLTHIFLTHHHFDHIDGVAALREHCFVIGNTRDAERLPELDLGVNVGDRFDFAGHPIDVLQADGHTIGHVAYYCADAEAVFSGDSLMVHGCGRLFEGTPEMMWETTKRIAALPGTTKLLSGHDYAGANLAFAAEYAPDAAALTAREAELKDLAAKHAPTTNITLAQDAKLNPYMRVELPEVQEAAGLPGGSALEVFAKIRSDKDAW